jgi:putative Holliday junction resolvase
MRSGRRIGIDYGAVRVGVAISSVDGLICSPLATLQNSENTVSEIETLVADNEVVEVYVGLPLNLKGDFTASTISALELARELSNALDVEVRLTDERLSTRAAQGQLLASGKNSKKSRSLIDAAAASLILEDALSFEKATGRQPGKPITEFDE